MIMRGVEKKEEFFIVIVQHEKIKTITTDYAEKVISSRVKEKESRID